jgi:hypothetical protein
MKQIWRFAISDGVPKRSLIVAMVVGTVVNLINQGDAIFNGLPLNVHKLMATYLVSYFVGTYGAVSFRLHMARLGKPDGTQSVTRYASESRDRQP